MKKIKLAVAGAGSRGTWAYAPYALENPHEAEVVGVAEPIESRRRMFCDMYGIKNEHVYNSWEEMLSVPKFCDALIIATQDGMHYAPAMKALELGYDILIEKPISDSPEECRKIAAKAEETGRLVMVCYVLRYTKFFRELKNCLESGMIGDIVSIQHNENVGFFHQAHSFVRGNWRNRAETSPMILAKCCHDMDILNWLIGKKCLRLSSFGSLKYFKEENAPQGSTARCLDGCMVKDTCPYYVMRYWEKRSGHYGFIRAVCNNEKADKEKFIEAAKSGPYGRCVFRCDNDVVDHQVVNMEYEDDITVAFTMCAFTDKIERTLKIMGTKGELLGHAEKGEIKINDFLKGSTHVIQALGDSGGHGGGDAGIMHDFLTALCEDVDRTKITDSLVASHEMAFAAEESRLTRRVIELK